MHRETVLCSAAYIADVSRPRGDTVTSSLVSMLGPALTIKQVLAGGRDFVTEESVLRVEHATEEIKSVNKEIGSLWPSEVGNDRDGDSKYKTRRAFMTMELKSCR